MTDYFHLNAAPDTVRAISSLGLAHLGDGVFELMVRSWLCLHGKATSKGLHRATVRYVAAPAQARAVERILPLLTGEEGDVFREADQAGADREVSAPKGLRGDQNAFHDHKSHPYGADPPEGPPAHRPAGPQAAQGQAG